MSDRQEQWVVFWCSLLSPFSLYGEGSPTKGGSAFLNELAACEQVFPDGQRRRPSRATLWRKWKKYGARAVSQQVLPQAAEGSRPAPQGHAGDDCQGPSS